MNDSSWESPIKYSKFGIYAREDSLICGQEEQVIMIIKNLYL